MSKQLDERILTPEQKQQEEKDDAKEKELPNELKNANNEYKKLEAKDEKPAKDSGIIEELKEDCERCMNEGLCQKCIMDQLPTAIRMEVLKGQRDLLAKMKNLNSMSLNDTFEQTVDKELLCIDAELNKIGGK